MIRSQAIVDSAAACSGGKVLLTLQPLHGLGNDCNPNQILPLVTPPLPTVALPDVTIDGHLPLQLPYPVGDTLQRVHELGLLFIVDFDGS
jgi:hypothetical protein